MPLFLAAAGLVAQGAGLLGGILAENDAADADFERAQAELDQSTQDLNIQARDAVRAARQQVASVRAQQSARGVGLESSGRQGIEGSIQSQLATDSKLAKRRFSLGVKAINAGAKSQAALRTAGQFGALAQVGSSVFTAAGGFKAFSPAEAVPDEIPTRPFTGTPQSSPVPGNTSLANALFKK